LEFEGQLLGPKSDEFLKFISLPSLVREPIEIVLTIDPQDPDINYLSENGWVIESPRAVHTPGLYRKYVSESLGEFSCTKGGYSGTQCGWFSDRSACYLAAGRPVVLQSTGFEDLLPVGKGLFSVSSPDEAADAIHRIRSDYQLHSNAARAIACEHFDSDKVVRDILISSNIV
jgi:glycosyltransferase involved in cell wall biosynthesis